MDEAKKVGLVGWAIVFFAAVNPLLENVWGYDASQLPRIALLSIAVVFIAILWIKDALDKGVFRIAGRSVAIPALAFCFAVGISTLGSIHRPTSLFGEVFGFRYEGLLTLLAYLVLFMATVNFVDREVKARKVILALLLGSTLASIYGVAQHFGYDLIPAGWYGSRFDLARSFSTFGNATYFGAFLSVTFPLSLFLLISSGRYGRYRPLLAVSTATSFLALIFTYTRAAWLGVLLGVLFVGSMLLKDRRVRLGLVVASLALALLFGTFSVFRLADGRYTVWGRLASAARLEGAVQSRLLTWEPALRIAAGKPLIGTGPDTFGLAFPKYRPKEWARSTTGELTNKAHSDLLQMASTTGMIGLLAYLWLLVAIVASGVRRLARLEGTEERLLIGALLAGVIGYLVQAQFGLAEVSATSVFWLVAGLLVAASGSGREVEVEAVAAERYKGGACRALQVSEAARGAREIRLAVPPSLARAQAVIIPVVLLALILIAARLAPALAADRALREALDLQGSGQYSAALAEYERAAALFPDEDYLLRLGQAQIEVAKRSFDQRSLGAAIMVLEKAARANPLDERAYFYLGQAHILGGLAFDRHHLDLAVAVLMKAVKLDPNFARTHLELGVAYSNLGNWQRAVKEWRKATELDPGMIEAYIYLARTYSKRGSKAEAEAAYRKVVQIAPGTSFAKEALDKIGK